MNYVNAKSKKKLYFTKCHRFCHTTNNNEGLWFRTASQPSRVPEQKCLTPRHSGLRSNYR